MFPPNFWLADPFEPFIKRPSPVQTPYSYDYYNTSPPTHTHTHRIPKKYQHAPTYTPSTSATDLDTITDTDTLDPTSPPYAHKARHRSPPAPTPVFQDFPTRNVRLPLPSAHLLHPNEILVLPTTLTHLKISLESTASPRTTVRAAVPPSMRLRDVVRQVVSAEHLSLARVYVLLRGEWVEAGAPLKDREVGELGRYVRGEREDGSVRVRVVVEQREREREVERRGFGFEMGGRVERMRVY
ncbi:hypothetical protein BDU57DRAFT_451763 [Ampelomyces quisqualis]|uniref:Uncharacterized protein n=1 Tax=Ampelomyces quisqualis TaxID=50730 RepID=A0A6A5QL12_AMPQU|nr:hypothetical protein BDU57DRAFT_451763 [Ampelomyces quisqualis]